MYKHRVTHGGIVRVGRSAIIFNIPCTIYLYIVFFLFFFCRQYALKQIIVNSKANTKESVLKEAKYVKGMMLLNFKHIDRVFNMFVLYLHLLLNFCFHRILSRLKHPHIVSCYHSFFDKHEENLYILQVWFAVNCSLLLKTLMITDYLKYFFNVHVGLL